MLFVFVPLAALGLFTLGQMIELRQTTTKYHKAINAIRARWRSSYDTPLSVSDEEPKYFAFGFNFFTVVITAVITSTIVGYA